MESPDSYPTKTESTDRAGIPSPVWAYRKPPRNQHCLSCWSVPIWIGIVTLIIYLRFPLTSQPQVYSNRISTGSLHEGLKQCAQNDIRPVVDYSLAERRIQSVGRSGSFTLFKNGTLIDGTGATRESVSIVIQDDIFITICGPEDFSCMKYETNSVVHELGGRYITPGLVDMHSHAGVRQVPELWASEDVTEVNHGSLSPWARAIDGLKPHDMGISLLRGGGITTSLVLTGAKNLISGEGTVIKMRLTHSLPDLLFPTSPIGSKPQRYLKMACGENIKSTFGTNRLGPNSREGMSFDVRQAYSKARDLKRRQDDWCELAQGVRGRSTVMEPYPEDLTLQTLVDVLRGDVRVNVHCYEPQDVYAMYSQADEFGFNVTAMHHALEAHHVIDLIKSHNTMLATFSDEWGFKKEVYGASAYMLKTAADANIPIALTSDHPAKNGQYIMYEAQIGHHFGLSTELTMASLTGVPAQALGIDNRVGHVKAGFDANAVVWDRHPLQLGARPLQVILEGKTTINASSNLWEVSTAHTIGSNQAPKERTQPQDPTVCHPKIQDIIIEGIVRDFFTEEGHGSEDAKRNMTLVVQNGKISCLGEHNCSDLASSLIKNGTPSMSLADGYLLPGITMVTRNHGLAEILSEPSTSDGISNGENTRKPPKSSLGLSFDGLHLERAHRAGITRLITPPRSSGMMHGVSTAFRPGAFSVLEDSAIVREETALHFTIGHEAKSQMFPTVSSQLEELKYLLTEGASVHSQFERAVNGETPIVIHTGNKDVITKIIRIKIQQPKLRLIIMGGAEAHLVAHDLARAKIPVIVAPWMCHPWSWEVRNCLPGPPFTEKTLIPKLFDAGVTVALGNWDPRDRYVRNALWEASWAAGSQNPRLAIDLISRNVEKILLLPPSDHFVVYSGNPFEFGSSVAVIFEEGQVSSCWPDVE